MVSSTGSAIKDNATCAGIQNRGQHLTTLIQNAILPLLLIAMAENVIFAQQWHDVIIGIFWQCHMATYGQIKTVAKILGPYQRTQALILGEILTDANFESQNILSISLKDILHSLNSKQIRIVVLKVLLCNHTAGSNIHETAHGNRTLGHGFVNHGFNGARAS